MAAAASTVTLDSGLTLSYAEHGGASEPALVLLPGPTDSWRSYEPTLEQMPLGIRTVAVSQRGHGDSDKPATGYRVEDLAADVPPLLDALGIERAILAGHSGSCLVARRVAIDQPDRVAGLVLEASPSTLNGDPRLIELIETVVSTLDDPIDPALARAFVVDLSSDEVAPDLQDVLVAELLKVPARVWREMFAGLLHYDDVSELRRITAPTLLIWGDGDGLVGSGMQDELLSRLSSATLVTYPGIGHTPRWEDPRRFASDVCAFVERLRQV
jgi:pimeloyl-ACP methyl ester carboxylesterase